MIRFKVSAPGKVILYGEHAVVYGKTAIAASVDLRTTLEFEELPNIDELQVCLPKINLNLIIPLSQIRELLSLIKVEDGIAVDHNLLYGHVQNLVKLLSCVNPAQKLSLEALCYLLISISLKEQLQVRSFRIHLSTALSVSSGLGSSASYAVCLSACFLNWSRLQKNIQQTFDTNDLQTISNYAYNCEKIMHGNPSGIDNSVCTFGSIIEFRKDNCFNPIFGVRSMKVLLVDTRVQRNTKKLVGTLAELKQNYPGIIEPILESIDNIAKEAVGILKKIRELPSTNEKAYFDGYAQLMTLIDINQGLLASCQVSHPSLDRICAEARNYSFAAKLTGAGGGGYAYVLLPPDTQPETISSLSRKLIADGYSVTLTNLGCAGVQVHN